MPSQPSPRELVRLFAELIEAVDQFIMGQLKRVREDGGDDRVLDSMCRVWYGEGRQRGLAHLLRERGGTATGFSWLPEYLVFKLVLSYLEAKLGISFRGAQAGRFVANVNGRRLELLRNAKLGCGRGRAYRPDVLVKVCGRPIAAYEVKTSFTGPRDVRGLRQQLAKLIDKHGGPRATYLCVLGNIGGARRRGGGSEGTTIDELRGLLRVAGGLVKLVTRDRDARRRLNRELRRDLGWRACITISEALTETARLVQEELNRSC